MKRKFTIHIYIVYVKKVPQNTERYIIYSIFSFFFLWRGKVNRKCAIQKRKVSVTF